MCTWVLALWFIGLIAWIGKSTIVGIVWYFEASLR